MSILAVVRAAVAAELRYGSRDFLAAFVAVGRLPVVDLRAQRAAATRERGVTPARGRSARVERFGGPPPGHPAHSGNPEVVIS